VQTGPGVAEPGREQAAGRQREQPAWRAPERPDQGKREQAERQLDVDGQSHGQPGQQRGSAHQRQTAHREQDPDRVDMRAIDHLVQE